MFQNIYERVTNILFERILLASSCLLSSRRSLSGVEPVGASQSKNDEDIAHYEAQSARHEVNNGREEGGYYPEYCSYNILCECKDGSPNC